MALEHTDKKSQALCRLTNGLINSDGVPSEALRKFHRQVLEKSLMAIDSQTVKDRCLSSSILAVRESDFKKAEKMIQRFRTQFAQQMTAKPGNEVYALAIQYFRLSTKNI